MSCRKDEDRLFHTLGPATAKLLVPKTVMCTWNDACLVRGRLEQMETGVRDKADIVNKLWKRLPKWVQEG